MWLKLSIGCCKLISKFSYNFSTYVMRNDVYAHTCISQHAVRDTFTKTSCLLSIFICSLVAFSFLLFLVFLNVTRLYSSRRTQCRCGGWERCQGLGQWGRKSGVQLEFLPSHVCSCHFVCYDDTYKLVQVRICNVL